MTMNDSTPPKPKRRWFRFSLRTLMVFILVVGMGLGWLGSKIQQAMRQERAVDGLRNSAGNRHFGGGEFMGMRSGPPASFVRRRDGGLLQRWFGDGFAPVCEMILGDNIEGGALIHLKGLPQLETLRLDRSNVTDADLGHLALVPQLKTLNLEYTKITDAGLAHLTVLTQLQSLNIECTNVTDAGLVHLKRLTQLQELRLSIPHADVKKFQEALPNCWVTTDPPAEPAKDARPRTQVE